MFNRSQIMKAAWASYRTLNRIYGQWQRDQIEHIAAMCSFKNCLRVAWEKAKAVIKDAKLNILMATDARAMSLANQIMILDYKAWTPERAELKSKLQTQLNSLAA